MTTDTAVAVAARRRDLLDELGGHGTAAALDRHAAFGEPPCDLCARGDYRRRVQAAEFARNRRAARKADMNRDRRRAVLQCHLWATGLIIDPAAVAEPAAVTVCDRAPDMARDLLEMLGLMHPDGPVIAQVPAEPRSKPVRNAHRKRAKSR